MSEEVPRLLVIQIQIQAVYYIEQGAIKVSNRHPGLMFFLLQFQTFIFSGRIQKMDVNSWSTWKSWKILTNRVTVWQAVILWVNIFDFFLQNLVLFYGFNLFFYNFTGPQYEHARNFLESHPDLRSVFNQRWMGSHHALLSFCIQKNEMILGI